MSKRFDQKTLFFACISGLLMLVSSGNAEATANSTGYVHITKIQAVPGINGVNNVYLGTTTNWPNIDGCTNPAYIIVEDSVANYNLLMTMLYDAYVNGDTVNFTLNGCVGVGGGNTIPIVTAFFLQKS